MTFKKGDLVMLVRGMHCCGQTDHDEPYGLTFSISSVFVDYGECIHCGYKGNEEVTPHKGIFILTSRLKKIDPPAEGETREAYKNLKVPA